MRWNITFCRMWMYDRDKKRWIKVQGVLQLSCPCVMFDEDGDKVVSLLEAAVSFS